MKEIEALERTLDSLKRKARPYECEVVDRHLRHHAIRRAIQPSFLAAAELRSLLSEYVVRHASVAALQASVELTLLLQSTRLQSPAEGYIHLTKDVRQRHSVLLSMKAERLWKARHFLEHRFSSIDPRRMFFEKQEFDSLDGGYCTVQCDMIRFEGVQSLKQVFDSVLFNITSMELSISDHTGSVSVRMDNDDIDPMDGIAQVRMVSTLPSGLQSDCNFVLFSEYCQDSDKGESAILTADFVDQDDLFPFRPHERSRKDPTAFSRMMCLPREDESEPLVVVVQRWTSMHLRLPQFPVSAADWQQLTTNMTPWTETMHKNIAAGVQSAASKH